MVNTVPVVSYPASGHYACIRQLYGTAQPLCTACRKRINCHNKIRLHLAHHTLYYLKALHACLSHHARHQAAHTVYILVAKRIPAIFLYYMAGNKQAVNASWPKRIRSYISVSKPDNKRRIYTLVTDSLYKALKLS